MDDAVASSVVAGPDKDRARSGLATWQIALVTAAVGTLAYYLPILGALLPGRAHWPGFITGDQRIAYFPAFMEGYRRFWHGGLLGIDFLTDDGASVFAYRPNFMPFYPPFILSYFFVNCSNVLKAALAYTVIHVCHQFVGLFFSVVYARRFLSLPAGVAILAATIYSLDWYASFYQVEASFYFQMHLLPLAACTLCWLAHRRSVLAPIWVSAVFVVFALSNYAPTMLASLGLAVLAASIAFWLSQPRVCRRDLPGALTGPVISLGLAGLVCLPYFVGQFGFSRKMSQVANDLDSIAHNLAFNAYDLLNGLSSFLDIHRTRNEAFLVWGAVPVFISLVGLQTILRNQARIPRRHLQLAGVCFLIYIITLLPTFGTALLPASDAFFYGAPLFGKMHIFQRYLIFSSFFFALGCAALAMIAARYAGSGIRQASVYLGFAIWIGVAVACLFAPTSSPTDFQSLSLEAFLVAATGVTLATAPLNVGLIIVSMFCALAGLYNAYAIPLGTNRPDAWTIEADPIGPEINAIVDFIKANEDKQALSKIILASPEILPYFNRNLTWMLGGRVKLMSFQGYPPHLAVLADYSMKTFGNYGTFDVSWLKISGTDFVYWSDDNTAALKPLLGVGYTLGQDLVLAHGHHISKLLLDPNGAGVDTLLDLSSSNPGWPNAMQLDGWSVEDHRIVKTSEGQNRFGFHVAQIPGRSYRISMTVDEGSSGHLTIALGNKVVDEVDATGASQISVPVKTSAEGDLWIWASPGFKGSLSDIRVVALLETPDGVAPGQQAEFDNGIIRAYGAGNDIKHFWTDYTKRIQMDLESSSPTTLVYLLWPNPYMVPYVDGRRVDWSGRQAPVSIQIGPGRHHFELRFVSMAGTVFVWLQYAYIVLVLAAFIAWVLRYDDRIGSPSELWRDLAVSAKRRLRRAGNLA